MIHFRHRSSVTSVTSSISNAESEQNSPWEVLTTVFPAFDMETDKTHYFKKVCVLLFQRQYLKQ